MIWCPPVFGGHFMHQSTALQKVHRNSRLRLNGSDQRQEWNFLLHNRCVQMSDRRNSNKTTLSREMLALFIRHSSRRLAELEQSPP